jgi:hypothetical protein
MYELILSPEEIAEVTGYKRYTKQQHQLRQHGIPFTTGPRNQPIVLRKNISINTSEISKDYSEIATEPDYSSLDRWKTKKLGA